MNIIDIIILAVLGLSLVSGMHKGFLASTLALGGFVGSWFASIRLYEYVSKVAQSNTAITLFLHDILSKVNIVSELEQAGEAVSGINAGDQVLSAALSALDGKNLSLIKPLFERSVITRAFEGMGYYTLAEYFTQSLVAALLNVLAFIVTLAVVYFVALLLVNLINNVFKLPALRHADWLLGGLFGLLRGVFIVLLFFAVIPTASQVLANMDAPILNDMIADSSLGGFFKAFGPRIFEGTIGQLL